MSKPATKVLHVLGELRPSGAETMVLAAQPYWESLDIETEVVSLGTSVGTFADRFRASGITIHHVPFAKDLRFFLELFMTFRKVRPDVVHIHAERAAVWVAAIARLAGVATVVRTIHHVFEFEGLLRIRRMITRHIMRGPLRVKMITNSPTNLANEWSRFRYRPSYIPNWIDDRHYRRASAEDREIARRQFRVSQGSTVVVTIGSCTSYKNHDLVISAMAASGVDQVLYLHAGSETAGFPERRLSSELGIEENVRFLGVVEDPAALIAAADLYLMPSTVEGFGIAALEALAVGTPCVLANVPGLRDFKRVFDEGIAWVEPSEQALRAVFSDVAATLSAIGRPSESSLVDFTASAGASSYARLYT